MSSGHDFIHSPASFPIWGFIMINGDCHILCARVQTVQTDYAPGLSPLIVQSPTKLNAKI